MALNSKEYEKMLEIFVSLEPMNPRPVGISKFNKDIKSSLFKLPFESCKSSNRIRNPSLPLIAPTPSIRMGFFDRRQSLFLNDGDESNEVFSRTSLYSAKLKHLSKVTQENDCDDIDNRDTTINSNVHQFRDDADIFHDGNFIQPSDEEDLNSQRDNVISLIIDPGLSNNFLRKNSFEIKKMKELRQAKYAKHHDFVKSVDDKQTNNEVPQISNLQSVLETVTVASPPSSNTSNAEHSSSDSEDRQSTISLQSSPTNKLTNISKEIVERPQSTSCNSGEIEMLISNNEDLFHNTAINVDEMPAIAPEPQMNNEEPSVPKPIPEIKSIEEQIKFYRDISNKLSLNSHSTKEIIKFFTKHGATSSQIIDKFQTAISVCNALKKKFNIPEETSCEIIEDINKESLERPLEDHENILEIFYSWGEDSCQNRFVFQENPSMYAIFKNPNAFLDEIKYEFEINDTLWIKGTNSKWMRVLCFIRECNIYYSLKQGSKDKRDMYNFVDLKKADFFTCSDTKRIKREFKAPTTEVIIFKENKLDHKSNDNLYLSTVNCQQKEKWLDAMRIAKYSFHQLKMNYLENQICLPTGFRSQANSTANCKEPYYPQESCSI